MKCQVLLPLKNDLKKNLACGLLQLIERLMLNTLSKNFSRPHFEIFVLFFPENQFWHFMQTVSTRDNSCFLGENKINVLNLLSAE